MNKYWGLSICLLGASVCAQVAPAAAQPTAAEVAAVKERLGTSARISPKERAAIAQAEAAVVNQQESTGFLEANQRKTGVITLPSGVQYRILKAHAGKMPQAGSTVRCRYVAHLVDGTVVDKVDDKIGAKMQVKGFVTGLQEALRRMPAGAKWEVVVPAALAFGAKGSHGVPGNAIVIYEFELVSIL